MGVTKGDMGARNRAWAELRKRGHGCAGHERVGSIRAETNKVARTVMGKTLGGKGVTWAWAL